MRRPKRCELTNCVIMSSAERLFAASHGESGPPVSSAAAIRSIAGPLAASPLFSLEFHLLNFTDSSSAIASIVRGLGGGP